MRGAPWHERHRTAVDLGLALFFVVLDTTATLAGGSWWPDHPSTLAWTLLAVQGAACLTLAARRRAPLPVVAVLGLFTLTVSLLISPFGVLEPAHQGNLWGPYATVLAAYGPVLHCENRRTAFVTLAAFTAVVGRVWEASPAVLTVGVLSTTVGPLLALYFDARKRLVTALTERAERAERERHLLAERARAEERTRLAGEMHDVVTHRLSLMVLQAGALRTIAPDEATRQTAEELRAAGCQALEELRDLVGILRAPPDGEASPTEAEFATLIEESHAAGVPAELVQEGDRGLASPVVGRTAFQVVREGLTNARKHAPGARVTVRVHYGESKVRLSVQNTPPQERTSAGGLAATGSGMGIESLRQRIELVGGTLRAGRSPDGGFRLEATLPGYVPTVEAVV